MADESDKNKTKRRKKKRKKKEKNPKVFKVWSVDFLRKTLSVKT